jgi:hypothetical protein
MEIRYIVHSASPTAIDVEAVVNGETMLVTAQGYVVELVSESGIMSHTLKAMPGADVDFLRDHFPVGAVITGTFAVAAA